MEPGAALEAAGGQSSSAATPAPGEASPRRLRHRLYTREAAVLAEEQKSEVDPEWYDELIVTRGEWLRRIVQWLLGSVEPTLEDLAELRQNLARAEDCLLNRPDRWVSVSDRRECLDWIGRVRTIVEGHWPER